MSNILIRSSSKSYSVAFSEDLNELADETSIYIVDRALSSHRWVRQLDPKRVISVDGSESTKTIEFIASLLEQLATLGATRKNRLVAVGGGSVQDATTLCASLYMRGLPWIFVPSTYMSMADSCIGGKSAINVGKHKNLAGNFYPPDKIIISESFLESLGKSGIGAGLCEAVKIQIAKGPEEFQEFRIEYEEYCKSGKITHLINIATMSLTTKKWFVEVDEFDQNERKLLNYGHSFGHALESASGMSVPHGLAIGLGMIVANSLVQKTEYLEAVNTTVSEILKRSDFLFSEMVFDVDKFKEALKMDKKNSRGMQTLVLPDDTGQLSLRTQPFTDSDFDLQAQALMTAIREVSS